MINVNKIIEKKKKSDEAKTVEGEWDPVRLGGPVAAVAICWGHVSVT